MTRDTKPHRWSWLIPSFWLWVLVSLALHAGLWQSRPFHRILRPASHPLTIALHYKDPAPEPNPAAPSPGTSPAHPTKSRPAKLSPKTVAAATPATPLFPAPTALTYSDLLPKKGEAIPTTQAGSTEPASRIIPSTDQAIALQELSGTFDIPLAYRKSSGSAKAIAVLKQDDSAPGWMFASIDGDAVLRAVLYESLRPKKRWPLVRSLFTKLQLTEIRITLQQVSKITLQSRTEFEDETTWDKSGVTVVRTIHVATAMPGKITIPLGFALPDKYAERAKARDRQDLRDFEDSAAFHSVIRNRSPQ